MSSKAVKTEICEAAAGTTLYYGLEAMSRGTWPILLCGFLAQQAAEGAQSVQHTLGIYRWELTAF